MTEPGIELRLALRHASFTLDADLQLPSRGVTALFGPSGAGKTSCLRVLAGLDRYSGSYVAIDGEVWQDDAQALFVPAHRRRVGYVPQEAGLFPHLAVRANLEYGWRRAGRPSGVAWSEIVDLLDLGSLLERKPARLSGGERQRAAIARALLTDPRLLLLDEPLSALDAARKSEVLPYLQRLHERLSMPAIYVSHALDEVARLADHIVVLEGGRVVSAGPLSEVLAGIDVETSFAHDSSVVLETVVAEQDAGDRLSRLTFAGGSLFVSLRPEPPGSRLRCRINARDVSIATEPPAYLSTLNVIPATVIAGQPTHDQSQVLVRLDAGGAALVALITRRSWVRLGLGPGAKVWAVVKSAALVS